MTIASFADDLYKIYMPIYSKELEAKNSIVLQKSSVLKVERSERVKTTIMHMEHSKRSIKPTEEAET